MQFKKFDDIVGNDMVKHIIDDAIKTSKALDKPLDSIFISGASGMGKSTLAEVIAGEMGAHYEEVNCGLISTNPMEFTNTLLRIPDKSLLFFDEVHELSSSFLETVIYRYMDEGKIFVKYPDEIIPMKLQKSATIIAATNMPEQVPMPFLNRFGIKVTLQGYTSSELKEMTRRILLSHNYISTDDILTIVSTASRGVPRDIERLIRSIINYSIPRNITQLTTQTVYAALSQYGIDSHGLNDIDRRYITTLFHTFRNNPTGIKQLCTVLGESQQSIEENVEPFLVKTGYLRKTSRGRMLAPLGIELVMSYDNIN